MSFFDLLDKVPASFWGVVFGSFISVLTVWLTNRHSMARLLKQFEHERFVKAQERELNLKKEIFLEAAEAISVAISTLSSLSNLDIPNNKVLERYSEKSPAIAKVQVVATSGTIEKLLEVTGEYGSQVLRLFATRHRLMAVKNQIATQDGIISALQQELDRAVEKMKQHNISGVVEKNQWDALVKYADFEQGRLEKNIQKRQEVATQFGLQHLDFIGECSAASLSLSSQVAPLLISVRKELELPLSLDDYKRSADKSIAKQRDNMNQYLGHFAADIRPAKTDNSGVVQ
ncbi:hypothetical protein [Polaromonas sp. YR568]|uniref:hypothetical protein n=1 Tax=Polaromonas sp. YR568 TaxID=1855301 RepID=UPI00313788BB